ncbi:MAG: hypothetical protein M1834_004874 [Cirrosporium novae-zelandiae]|nr:MAG: hypothetical protein M1834_004874 [Cirrosporium novae-zelandiae]
MNNSPELDHLNVLVLDGGGVRGLSSLLILEDLIRRINENIRSKTGLMIDDLKPHQVFDLVVGTSTGGLIAIMIGKLGLSAKECINQYRNLSKEVFGRYHLRGKLSMGVFKPRYSGECLRDCVKRLLRTHDLPENFQMRSSKETSNQDSTTACAVVCRRRDSRYSPLVKDAVFICSLKCLNSPNSLDCGVCDAARATSAAPTYFPPIKIGNRYFIDGAVEYNNPSFALFQHYRSSLPPDVKQNRRETHTSDLNFQRIRMVNLGTGNEPQRDEQMLAITSRSIVKRLRLFRSIRDAVVNGKDAIKIATTSQTQAEFMETLSQANESNGDIKYYRLSDNTGVCYIKLDDYKKLDDIQNSTLQYLNNHDTVDRLERIANEITESHINKMVPNQPQSQIEKPRNET